MTLSLVPAEWWEPVSQDTPASEGSVVSQDEGQPEEAIPLCSEGLVGLSWTLHVLALP